MEQFDGFTKELVKEWESMTGSEQQTNCAPVAASSSTSPDTSLVSSQSSSRVAEPAVAQQHNHIDKFIVQKQIQLSKKIMGDPTISDRIKKICSEMIQEFFAEVHAEEAQLVEENLSTVEEKKNAFLSLPNSSYSCPQSPSNVDRGTEGSDTDELEFLDFDDEEKGALSLKRKQQMGQSINNSSCKISALPQMARPRVVFEDDESSPSLSAPSPAIPSPRIAPLDAQQQSSAESKSPFFSSLLDTFQSVYGYISNVFGGIWSKIFGTSRQQLEAHNQQQQQLDVQEEQEVSDEEEKLMNGIIGGALFLITGFLFYVSVKKFAPDLSKAFAGAISTFFVGTTARRTRTFANKRF